MTEYKMTEEELEHTKKMLSSSCCVIASMEILEEEHDIVFPNMVKIKSDIQSMRDVLCRMIVEQEARND